jgi:hypothetical protein
MTKRSGRFIRVRIAHTIHAPRSAVWAELRQLDRHVLWMKDAVSITFHGDQREGVGTSFTCKTKIGPFRTNDEMTITSWIEEREMTVHHQGLITGAGRFVVRGDHGRHCVIRWEERLSFPWYFGGNLTGTFAKPIFKAIWRRNLDRLGELVLRNLEAEAAARTQPREEQPPPTSDVPPAV